MSSTRLEWKVGGFVLLCLALLGGMMLSFSKGLSPLGSTYELILTTRDVGGIQKNAAVRMAGVRIGQVTAIDYDSEALEVRLRLSILNRHRIPRNAQFSIETAGFLGEQYVAVTPQERSSDVLRPGDKVASAEPFNIQEAARSAMQLIENVDRTVSNLNAAVIRVDRTLLSDRTLTNLTLTVENFRKISEDTLATVQNFRDLSARAQKTVDRLDLLVQTNSPAVSGSFSNLLSFTEKLQAVSNLVAFSEHLNRLGAELRETVSANRSELSATMKNLETASASLRELMGDLQAGKGLAGSLLKSERLDMQATLLLSNLTVLSSNLNRFGLLYKPRPPKTPRTNAPVNSPFPSKWPFPD